MSKEVFQKNIIKWYQKNGRSYPWRETKNPFFLLIAEILLRRTGAGKTEQVYRKIIELYPTPQRLSRAKKEDIRAIIKDLGLTKRAELVIELSKELSDKYGGEVPSNYRDLISLKGVGEYIANALLCFSFNQKIGIVDGSIKRVISRYWGIDTSDKIDRSLWNFAQKLLPDIDYVHYNYGILDIAHFYCKPRKCLCPSCPLNKECLKYKVI